jgi:hypothetical protein
MMEQPNAITGPDRKGSQPAGSGPSRPTPGTLNRHGALLGRGDSLTSFRLPGYLRTRATRVAVGSGWAPVTMLIVGIVVGGLLLHLTRGTSFWFDEWNFILYRRGDDPGTFLRPYNGHLSLVPIFIYRVLLATVGLRHYAVYRVVATVGQLSCVALVFFYVRRRISDPLALAFATLVLLFGAGWQDFLWPFQIAWLISLGSGIGMLMMLDRRDRPGTLGACGLLALALASSGIGIIIGIGAVVETLQGHRGRRRPWVVLAPLIPYAVWWVTDQRVAHHATLSEIPHFFVDAAGAAVGGLIGRSGAMTANGGQLLTWGRPLAAVALVALLVRVVALRRVPPRLFTVMAMLASFWLATAYSRAYFAHGDQAWASRYIYIGGVLLLLLLTEALRGVSIPASVMAVIAALVVVAIASNVTENLRPGAAYLRDVGQQTNAVLGALQIARPVMPPGYVSAYLPGAPLITMPAARFFAAAHAYGSPADSASQIASAPQDARRFADLELIRIHDVGLRPVTTAPSRGVRPRLVTRPGGDLQTTASCLRFAPGATVGSARFLNVVLPATGLWVRALRGEIAVGVRRFASDFVAVGALRPGGAGELRIAPDAASAPWQVDVATTGTAEVCGLP